MVEQMKEFSRAAEDAARHVKQLLLYLRPVAGPRILRRIDRLNARNAAHRARRPQLLHKGRKP